ncbi:MAG: transcriptional regulator, ArsR family [Myxococcaceae bacterium]|nr:transcriptional regulator, ArsR family [Myxococcaceae bacterium]
MDRFSIASVGALVGEPTRCAILLALLDGRSRPAGELARAAGLSAAATSLHLGKLVAGGLLAVQKEGRHRNYSLASPNVAHALEAIGVIATRAPPARSLSLERAKLREARTCYDHLAGAYAVALAQALEQQGVLRRRGDRAYHVTKHGVQWLGDVWQIDVADLSPGRFLARQCLDWTERRPHIAGAIGAAVLSQLFEKRWIARVAGSRTVRITSRGHVGLANLGILSQSPINAVPSRSIKGSGGPARD